MGSGRRRGKLSNIHLGARGEDGELVMLGKTFKGMTDEMLAWQTERFLELETHRDDWTVHLRPEQVVEVAAVGGDVQSGVVADVHRGDAEFGVQAFAVPPRIRAGVGPRRPPPTISAVPSPLVSKMAALLVKNWRRLSGSTGLLA